MNTIYYICKIKQNLNIKYTMSVLTGLNADTFLDNEKVREQFKKLMMKLHDKTELEADAIMDREVIYFKQAMIENDKIKQATILSLYSTFLEIAIQNLSIKKQPKAEAYVGVNGVKSGSSWVQVAKLAIQAHGELILRKRAKQLIHASNPIVVYEGDTFQPFTNDNGVLIVDYKPAVPRKSHKIIACFIKLQITKDIFDYKWLLPEDIERLHNVSKKFMKNETGNALYSGGDDGQIDVGFLETKTLKHSLSTLGRLELTSGSILDDDTDSDEVVEGVTIAGNTGDDNNANTLADDFNEAF